MEYLINKGDTYKWMKLHGLYIIKLTAFCDKKKHLKPVIDN